MIRQISLAASVAFALPASAEATSTSANYLITIAGLEIGEIAVKYSEGDGSYTLDLDGGFRFLFISGAAEGRVRGAKAEDGFTPASYRLRFDGPTREVISDISFKAGRPDAWSIMPEPKPEWFEDRIPLAESDMPGSIDPVSAFLILATSAAEACTRQQKVFSGFVRFDLTLTPGAPAAKGVIPCKVGYEPISGHRVDSEGVAQLRAGQGLEVSMAELAPGVWAPHYIGFGTRIGTLAFQRKR